MTLLDWSDRLSVGVTSVDNQHRELVRLLNELSDAMMEGKGQERLEKVLSGLVSYTASHFAHEEQLMEEYAYPDATAHKKQHDELKIQALAFQQKVQTGTCGTITFELLGFLKNWLVQHIQGTDGKLGKFIVEQKQAKTA